MTNDDKDLKQQLIELAWEIEKLPASEQQTKVITMLTDIRSKATPQHPSEPLKELDEKAILMVLDQCCPVSMDKMAKEMIAQILWNKFGQPSEKKALIDGIREVNKMTQEIFDAASEKKALSVLDIARIIHKESGSVEPFERASTGEQDDAMATAQAIHSALPAQREVRYPEKEYCGKINTALHNDNCEECKYHKLRNKLIDKMKKLNGG